MKKIIYNILVTICLVLCVTTAKAQKANTADNIFYGGGLGFSVIQNYWMLNIAPTVGYRFTPSLSGGISLLYAYESYKKRNPDYTINSYGGGAFIRYSLGAAIMKALPFTIFFQTDYEGRQEEVKYKNTTSYSANNYSQFQNKLFLGAGYSQLIGKRTRAYAMVSVDLLHLGGCKAIRPLIRVGIEL